MNKERAHDFISYEYKEISAAGPRASLLMDCYASLGWETDVHDGGGFDTKKIILRRNRKIINKAELTRLQRNLEACVAEIDSLEKSKKTKANIVSLSLGLIGTAFMAGSVFAITAQTPIVWLCIVFAVPAFLLWALAPLLHPRMIASRTKIVNELIEKKFDEMYEICEKGNKLLV